MMTPDQYLSKIADLAAEAQDAHERGDDDELITRVNTWLIDILGEPGSLTIGRITRVTEEIQDGYKEPGFVCVWID